MAKYGEENFTLEIIDFADTYDELKEKEKYWIKQYDSMNREKGYNLTKGGDGTFGRMHSEETKEKIRQKALGRKASEETKKKMSESRKGIVSEKKKIHVQGLIEHSKKKVLAEDVLTKEVREFNSMKECREYYNIDQGTLRKYCVSSNHLCKKCNTLFYLKEH